MPTYRFLGTTEEDFPAPPIARRLQPGDVIETPEPVEHARLELQSAAEDDRPAGDEADPAQAAKTSAAGRKSASAEKE